MTQATTGDSVEIVVKEISGEFTNLQIGTICTLKGLQIPYV